MYNSYNSPFFYSPCADAPPSRTLPIPFTVVRPSSSLRLQLEEEQKEKEKEERCVKRRREQDWLDKRDLESAEEHARGVKFRLALDLSRKRARLTYEQTRMREADRPELDPADDDPDDLLDLLLG